MAGDLKALGSGAGKARKAGAIGIGKGRARRSLQNRHTTVARLFRLGYGLQVRLPPDVPARALLQVVSNSDASLFATIATTNDDFRASVTDKAVGHFERDQSGNRLKGSL